MARYELGLSSLLSYSLLIYWHQSLHPVSWLFLCNNRTEIHLKLLINFQIIGTTRHHVLLDIYSTYEVFLPKRKKKLNLSKILALSIYDKYRGQRNIFKHTTRMLPAKFRMWKILQNKWSGFFKINDKIKNKRKGGPVDF